MCARGGLYIHLPTNTGVLGCLFFVFFNSSRCLCDWVGIVCDCVRLSSSWHKSSVAIGDHQMYLLLNKNNTKHRQHSVLNITVCYDRLSTGNNKSGWCFSCTPPLTLTNLTFFLSLLSLLHPNFNIISPSLHLNYLPRSHKINLINFERKSASLCTVHHYGCLPKIILDP